MEKKPLSLYIHIPFCLKKCSYCDFLSAPQDEETRERYVQALIREILYSGSPSREVDTVFFGGGTPSVLSGQQIERILRAAEDSFHVKKDAEISMELNPGTADKDKIHAFRLAGINRLSIGVQSMHEEELRILGRIHSVQQARETFQAARESGFDNINIDLMSALPGQTFQSWAESLAQAVLWAPEHISAYSLIIEPAAPFAKMYREGALPPLPDEETDRDMYHFTGKYLGEHGMERYEISNYAMPGRECRHNTGYWTGHSYLGFGIGAASYMDGTRFSNIADLGSYLECMGRADPLSAIHEDERQLPVEERMEEYMFLGLRMTRGVSEAVFADRFERTMEDVYGDVIRKHIAQGVVSRTNDGICLTERGIDVSNYILADYLL